MGGGGRGSDAGSIHCYGPAHCFIFNCITIRNAPHTDLKSILAVIQVKMASAFCSPPAQEHFFWSHTHSGGRKITFFWGVFRGLGVARFLEMRCQKTPRTWIYQSAYFMADSADFLTQREGHETSTKSLLSVFMWERQSRLCAGANEMADSARQFTHQSEEPIADDILQHWLRT